MFANILYVVSLSTLLTSPRSWKNFIIPFSLFLQHTIIVLIHPENPFIQFPAAPTCVPSDRLHYSTVPTLPFPRPYYHFFYFLHFLRNSFLRNFNFFNNRVKVRQKRYQFLFRQGHVRVLEHEGVYFLVEKHHGCGSVLNAFLDDLEPAEPFCD